MYGCLSVRLDASELSDEMNEYMNTSSTTARVSWNRASREERVVDVSPTRARAVVGRSIEERFIVERLHSIDLLFLKSVEHGDDGRAGDGDVCER